MPCPAGAGLPNISANMTTSPAAHYDVYASFYSTWPPASTPDLTCAQVQAGAVPAAVLVKSVGTAVNLNVGHPVQRTMESLAKLTPIYGGLGQAIFSDLQLNMVNKLTLNGNGSNNGDVYTNGNYTVNNNTVIGGSVYAQGSATIAQGVVKANVWAKTAVDLSSGIQVMGDGTSSTSSITLSNNSTINGNAKAGTTISGGTINGTVTQNSPSGPPPQLPLPKYCWPGGATLAVPPYCDGTNSTMSAYAAAGYTILPTFGTCAAPRHGSTRCRPATTLCGSAPPVAGRPAHLGQQQHGQHQGEPGHLHRRFLGKRRLCDPEPDELERRGRQLHDVHRASLRLGPELRRRDERHQRVE